MIVIQARAGSERFPGKVLRLLGGRPVLSWVIRAALEANVADRVVVATTDTVDDDDVAALARSQGASVVRGSTLDVQSRFLLALKKWPAEAVVRLTADCPLLDPELIADAARCRVATEADYLCNNMPRTLPRGFDVEAFTSDALRRASLSSDRIDRVHVTPHFYRNPHMFRVVGLAYAPPASQFRVTLDTTEDATVLDRVVEQLGDAAPAWRTVVEFLQSHPDIAAVNARVRHKELEEG